MQKACSINVSLIGFYEVDLIIPYRFRSRHPKVLRKKRILNTTVSEYLF